LAGALQSSLEAVSSGDSARIAGAQRSGRVLVEKMALLMQATILFESAPAEAAAGFASARLGPNRGREYGALPSDVDIDFLVERA
ncbi:MAG: DNA alkylation response protein, partial [Brevibacterium sp.]|nr:DNA alkylation response protein [Brevibacterium sp.]